MTERKNILHASDEVYVQKSKEANSKVVTSDRALGAACNGADWQTLDSEKVRQLEEAMLANLGMMNSAFPELVKGCPHFVRLAITCQVFRALVEHAKEGGSFRHLIYNRLGFEDGDYALLHLSGGTIISNEFDLSRYDEHADMKKVFESIGLSEEKVEEMMRAVTKKDLQ